MESSANQLIIAAQAGDECAAGMLITEFHAPIYAFLRRLAGNDEDAEDLAQRTFAQVWKSLGSFAGRSSVSSWLHGIAYHCYVDWRRADRPAEPQSDDWWAACPAPGSDPAELAAASDLAQVLYATVDRLPLELRTTVHLHYYQGLTLQETADAIGASVSTVKYRLRAALEQLQASLIHRPSRASNRQTNRQL